MCITVPNFIKIGQTIAEIWRFNGFYHGGRPPSWILEIQIILWSGRLCYPFCIIIPNVTKICQSLVVVMTAAILVF